MSKNKFEEEETPRTQFIIKDTNAALKIKREETKEAKSRYRAVVAKQREESKLELAKLKLQISAKEAASKHIAVFGPLYLLLLCGGFFAAIQYIPSTEIGVVSSILTLLITMIGANLRSIVAGENDSSTKSVVIESKNTKE
tara:strand:+ start:2335 stop:2757 length:423 start_codon:yes stop_codon:yes gene_type:complete